MRLLAFNLATDADDPVLGFTTGWLRALATRVEHVDVVTMRAGRLDLPANVAVHSVGREQGLGELRRALRFQRHLRRLLDAGAIDACFSHMIPIFSVLAAPWLRRRGIPLVTWYTHPHVSRTARLAHRLSDATVTADATSFAWGRRPPRVLGHGIDTTRFAAASGEAEDPGRVVAVGRLAPGKRLAVLVEALATLRRAGRRVDAALVGPALAHDRDHVTDLVRRIAAAGLTGAVTLTGPVPRDDLPAQFHRAALHVNLAPPGSFDKAPLEAMACGRPSLVASPAFAPTLGRLADDLVVDGGDPGAVARAIDRALALTPTERAAWGTELRERVVARHGLGRLADALVALLATLAARAPVAAAPVS